MMPMTTAAHGATNAHGAVIATSPASMPLHDIEMSGLPHLRVRPRHRDDEADARREQCVDRDEPIRRSVAPNVEPGLKPIHPNTRISVPITT